MVHYRQTSSQMSHGMVLQENKSNTCIVCHFLQICCLLYVWNCSAVVTNASKNCSLLIKHYWANIVHWWQHNVSWTEICGSKFMAPRSCLNLGVLSANTKSFLRKSSLMTVEHVLWWSYTPGWKTCSCHIIFTSTYFSMDGKKMFTTNVLLQISKWTVCEYAW